MRATHGAVCRSLGGEHRPAVGWSTDLARGEIARQPDRQEGLLLHDEVIERVRVDMVEPADGHVEDLAVRHSLDDANGADGLHHRLLVHRAVREDDLEGTERHRHVALRQHGAADDRLTLLVDRNELFRDDKEQLAVVTGDLIARYGRG